MKAAHSLWILGATLSFSSLALAADDLAAAVDDEGASTTYVVTEEHSDDAVSDADAPLLAAPDTVGETPHERGLASERSASAHSTPDEQRIEEVSEICDITCLNTTEEAQCNTECAQQTHFCFDRCDELSANEDDCFLSCTQIAVDYGVAWEESHAPDDDWLVEEEIPAGRKFAFGMNVIGGLHYVPKFALNALLDMSVPHWRDHPKFFYGGELVFRFDDRHDFLIGIDYSDFSTPDGWWLEKDDPATSTDWVENDIRALTITLGWNGIANLDKKKRVQIYGGVGLGAAIKIGDFKKAELSIGCVDTNYDLSGFGDLTPASSCPASGASGMLMNTDPDGTINDWEVEKIPAVLPSLVITAGFRYLIADTISIGVEGGFKTVAFYGGLKVGFIVGRTHKQAARAEMNSSARSSVATTPMPESADAE